MFLNTFAKPATCFCEYSNGFGVDGGIICGRTGTYHHVIECPQDHWCTGYSNKSSQVVSAMDLCEKGNIITIWKYYCTKNTKEVNTNQHPLNIYSATINCGYGQYAPRCSLCKLAHRTEDDSYNTWCGGYCYFDQEDGQCKIKGSLKMSKK